METPMMILKYASKKELAASVGQALRYQETSIFGAEFRRDGQFCGSNRPSITGIKGREFFAEVTMRDGLIAKVS
jgi:hypothetical protein